jgi:large subunit ribosomal protein L4
MDKKVYSVQGKEVGNVVLSDSVFSLPVNDDVIYYAIHNELANLRLGTACTKDRGEIHGSNAKPFKQKGTGRARQGDKKSPIFVGGGTIFGPKPRDYSYELPKKVKRLAMKSILSLKAQSDVITVVKDFSVESGKTKDLVKTLEQIVPGFGNERVVLIYSEEDEKLKRSARNLVWLQTLSYKRLRAHDLFYGRKIILFESAAAKLADFYADK